MNFDIAYEASEFVHFAAGAEVRNEGFTIEQGQNESWQFGPYAPQGFSAACNGFPGFSPIAVGSWDRSNSAIYADIELSDVEDRLIVGGRTPIRTIRRLRQHAQLEDRCPCRAHGELCCARQRQHRVPRADAGSAERIQTYPLNSIRPRENWSTEARSRRTRKWPP